MFTQEKTIQKLQSLQTCIIYAGANDTNSLYTQSPEGSVIQFTHYWRLFTCQILILKKLSNFSVVPGSLDCSSYPCIMSHDTPVSDIYSSGDGSWDLHNRLVWLGNAGAPWLTFWKLSLSLTMRILGCGQGTRQEYFLVNLFLFSMLTFTLSSPSYC